MTPGPVTYHQVDGTQALTHLGELRDIYTEVYAEPPYHWGQEHANLFLERLHVQARQPGFAMIEARHGLELTGMAFGVTLQPTTPWWQHLTTPLPDDITTEWPGRTFALVELLVRRAWRRQHIAQTMHDLLLHNRPEERATLTVLPAAQPARNAYTTWGWQTITQKRNPLPGSPLFDVMIKDLTQHAEPPPDKRG